LPPTPVNRTIPFEAIREAAAAVYRAAIRTPLIRLELSPRERALPELYLKLESLQPIGSFKIRGAYNVIRQLSARTLEQGVWTVSAGNAALGVAFAARELGFAVAGALSGRAGRGKIVAVVSGGNIDLSRFAALVGACENHTA
jgi:threonine dehydratase